MSEKKTVVYTCITGFYDQLKSPQVTESNVDYICFTDNQDFHADGWQVRRLPFLHLNNIDANRHVKMMPHIYLSEYDVSVYIDGNIEIVSPLDGLIESTLSNSLIALYEHPFRDCIYEEAMECLLIGYDWPWKIFSQLKRYKLSKYKQSNGLFECGVIFRRHHALEVINLMECWWKEYRHGVKRDQISLPFLAWKMGVTIKNIGKSDFRYERNYFSLNAHRNNRRKIPQRARGLFNRVTLPLTHKLFS